MASGWNLWVWLECLVVVSGCCCKEVYIYRFPHITYPYSTCIISFLEQHPYFFVNCFFVLVYFKTIHGQPAYIASCWSFIMTILQLRTSTSLIVFKSQ